MQATFQYGIDHLTVGTALAISEGKIKGILSESAHTKVTRSAGYVNQIAQADTAVYGINTGFGPLCTTTITAQETQKLQENLIKSHAVGMGEPIDRNIAKLMLILKVHALCQGYSGVSILCIERIIYFIDHDVIPEVRSQGSVGASGDLAPLSHLFLPLLGEGYLHTNGKRIPTKQYYDEHGISPIKLQPKDGLGLINGTQFIAAHACYVLHNMFLASQAADVCGAIMLEGLLGSISPFLPELHKTRPFKGNLYVASKYNTYLSASEIVSSHKDCGRVQDPYSLRCIPQVHGSTRNAWLHLKDLLEVEINSITDNPLVFNESHTISGGNFHGQPLAMVLDYACIAIAELGSISDRRSYLALEGKVPGVPKLLMKDLGLNSGFMIPQYTAAAIVSENKGLCHPASVDSIPTSLGQEDHVSMGSIASRKALQVCDNVYKVLAIELLSACQAYDFHRPLKSGKVIDGIYEYIRQAIPHLSSDGLIYTYMDTLYEMIKSGALHQLEQSLRSTEADSIEHITIFEKY